MNKYDVKKKKIDEELFLKYSMLQSWKIHKKIRKKNNENVKNEDVIL